MGTAVQSLSVFEPKNIKAYRQQQMGIAYTNEFSQHMAKLPICFWRLYYIKNANKKLYQLNETDVQDFKWVE